MTQRDSGRTRVSFLVDAIERTLGVPRGAIVRLDPVDGFGARDQEGPLV